MGRFVLAAFDLIEDPRWTLKSGGTVIELPSGPLTVAGGLEYRSESLIQGNDINSEFNNITSPDFAGHLLSALLFSD